MTAALTPDQIAERLAPWWATDPLAELPLNATTRALCDEGLRCLMDPAVLRAKMRRELPHAWRPLGRVLVVVAEGDVLGTVFALIAGALTGNALRIKARGTRALAEAVLAALDLPDAEVADWRGSAQDDSAVLAGVDGVLLAGSDALIRRYRMAAAPSVRLIEFGPKRSLAMIGARTGRDEIAALADDIWAAVTAFEFGVCSAPQCVYVDPAAPHAELWSALVDRLPHQPARSDRLAARVEFEAYQLTHPGTHVFAPNGWCVSDSADAPAGVRLVTADLAARAAQEHAHWGRGLQTIGTHGLTAEDHRIVAPLFSRVCTIASMHRRSPLAPHDGLFELGGLVDFTQNEIRIEAGPTRVFLTGATGFIGQHVARALRDRGHRVTALARPASRRRVPMGCGIVTGDVTDPKGWAAHLADHDAVLHLAADYAIGPVDVGAMHAINVGGTRAVLDAAIAAKVPRIVHVSSTAALGAGDGHEAGMHNGTFRSTYEATKHLAHGLARRRIALGAPVIIATPGGAFGPGDHSDLATVLQAAARGKLPLILAGDAHFTLCHVARLVDGLLRILEHSPVGEEWILTGTPTRLADLAGCAARLMGQTPPRPVSWRWASPVARLLDPVARRLRVRLPVSREALRVLADGDYLHQSTKAQRRLGWTPGDLTTDLHSWLRGDSICVAS